MDTLKSIFIIATSTFMIWLSAAIVSVATENTTLENAAVILAFLATLAFGMVAGLNSIDERHNAALREMKTPGGKSKREAAPAQDARVALLLSLLSDDERDSLKHRLIDDLEGDGEMLSLADLLAAQSGERNHWQK